MYRQLSRVPTRSISGHVCLSCRRQLHVTTQPREEESTDDWLSNFNDLCSTVEEAQPQSRKDAQKSNHKQRRDDIRTEKELGEPSSEAVGFDRLKAKLSYATNDKSSRTGRGVALDDISSSALEGIPRKAAATEDTSSDVRQTYESLLATLLPGSKSATKGDSLEELLNESTTAPQREFTTGANEWPGKKRLQGQFLSSHNNTKSRMFPSADGKAAIGTSGPVDDIPIAGGVVSPITSAASAQPTDLHSGKPMSIASKARVVRERPKWGGMTTAPAEVGPPFKASFDSLQRADKISAPPKRPSTAFTAQPWGYKGTQSDNGFADSPGDLAAGQGSNSTLANSAHSELDSSQSGSFSGLLGFKRLKNLLYGNGPRPEANEVGKHGTKNSSSNTSSNAHENKAQSTGLAENASSEDLLSTAPVIHRLPPGTKPMEYSEMILRGPLNQTARRLAREQGRKPERVQRALLKARSRRRDALLQARDKASLDEASETKHLEPSSHKDLDSTLSESASEGQMLDETVSEGHSLSQAMVGHELSNAMSTEPNSGHAAEEEYADQQESGLPMIEAKDLHITALNIEQPAVPGVSHGLDRVLFNPGVTPLQDQHSRVYNFDPYLQHIMPVEEFDFNALQQYKTSSQDSALSEIARTHNKKYVGSTSSMTSTLSHFHYLLSGWRDLNLGMLSRQFPEKRCTFTAINRAPTAIFLRWKNGTYAIDADKEHDSGNVLMMLGKSMEKLLTMSKSQYERYRKSDPRQITEEERNAPEAYEYTTMGDFLMRSQLDAHDPRLPGSGMFDIKTRAIASIRMSTSDYKPMLGYEILTHQGQWESYEREYYDMMRSTTLKYMLQARMGRMDGIFLAYHNVQRIFGFQYMPISEIDRAIHGQNDRCLGDQEFKLSVDLLNKVLEEATAKFPNKSLRLHFETRAVPVTAMYVFAEPMEEEQIDEIQSKSKEKIAAFERKMMGIDTKEEKPQRKDDGVIETTPAPPLERGTHAPLYAATILVGSRVNGERVERPERLRPDDEWTVEYLLKEMDDPAAAWATYDQVREKRRTTFSNAIMTDDEGGAEAVEGLEPNLDMHDEDGSLRTFESFYLEQLRQMAEKGREFRRKMDKLEKDHGKVVYGQPTTENVDAAEPATPQQQTPVEIAQTQPASEESAISSVDDYMSWMYADKTNAAPSGDSVDTTSKEPEIKGVEDYMNWMYKGRIW